MPHLRLRPRDERDRVHRQRLAAAGGVDAFVGLALDGDRAGVDAERAGQRGLHRRRVRTDLRAFGNHHDVDVDDLPAGVPDARRGVGQQHQAVGVLVARIRVGEQPADVAEVGRAEDRVGHRVAHGVGVGVAAQAAIVGDAHAAEDQRPALGEDVQVVAGADAEGRRRRARPGPLQVGGGRDLHVGVVAGDQPDLVAGLLGEHRLVGAGGAAAPGVDGRGEHVAPERLRRLRQEQRLARQRRRRRACRRAPPASPCRAPARPGRRRRRRGRRRWRDRSRRR